MKLDFNESLSLAADIAESGTRDKVEMAKEIHSLRLINKKISLENEKMKSLLQRWINSVDVSYAWDQKQLSDECGRFLSKLER